MLDFSRLTAIGREKPLLHCVSNIVSANDCANVGLAVGASPMMAQAPEEMAEITARSAATVLNTGTPSAEKFSALIDRHNSYVVVGIHHMFWQLHKLVLDGLYLALKVQ